MGGLVGLLRGAWGGVAIAILSGFLSGGCSALLIALICGQLAPGTSVASPRWAFVGLVAVALVTSSLSRILLVRFAQTAVYRLQIQLSAQILATELVQLEQIGLPRLLAVLTEDVQTLATAVAVIPLLCVNVSVVVGCMVYITWLSWQVLGLVVLLSLLASLSCSWLLYRGRGLIAQARNQQDRLFQHFRTLISGVKELKLNRERRQDFLKTDLESTAWQFRRQSVGGLSFFALLDSWGKLIYFFAIGLILFVIPHWIRLDTPTLFSYVLTFTYILGPMEGLVSKLPALSKASISLQNIDRLGIVPFDHLQVSNPQASNSRAIPASPLATPSWHSLRLENVTHTYRQEKDGSDFTLGPINLEISPGELIFIVGGNGSGKSTLAKLITGLYLPKAGQIYLDDQPITADNREQYCQLFSTLFADFYLFERIMGMPPTQQATQIQAYLQQLQLDRKVTIQAGHFSTTDLSQGQRKRLALLAAYLENRSIYLFDEWAADQDPLFKGIFYQQLLPELTAQGKTVIAISHDDHYFHLANRIIKLNYGQIESDHDLARDTTEF